jgi:hypothetical protein
MLYRAWAEGWGPKFYWVGASRRITHSSRLEWQREREAEPPQSVAHNVTSRAQRTRHGDEATVFGRVRT